MALAQRLDIKLGQSLVMTPQLLQSIRLLQLTHAELSQFIAEEIERNPFLEMTGAAGEASGEPQPSAPAEMRAEAGDWVAPELSAETSAESIADRLEAEPLAPDMAGHWKQTATGNGATSGEFDLEAVSAAPVTLGDHVREQIAFALPDSGDRLIALELADMLDETGYLRGDLGDVAARLGAAEAQVARVLSTLQRFDPPGLFAASLKECLAIQLRQRDRLDPAMATLLDHLDLLARRDFASLTRLCGVDTADLVDMLAEIRALDPKPGLAFAHEGMETVVPDVAVRAAPDGSWLVELNESAMPRVLVNHAYHARVSRSALDNADNVFLSECLQSANWLERSLDQRARTILKVATEIVRRQDGFLINGVAGLKPMTLKAVADAIAMHESTVSRVTANKFMATPRGTFELKYFFTAAIAGSSDGEAHSAEAVRHRIRQLIDAETVQKILSDDDIVARLGDEGIEIARRTVAKYREAMNIASSVQRRREKRALEAVAAA